MKKRDEQRLALYTYRQEGLIQAGPRAKKGRFQIIQKRSSEAAPEAAAEAAAEGSWVASTADLESCAVTAEAAEEETAGEGEQLCVLESIEVTHAAATLHLRAEPYMHPGCNRMHMHMLHMSHVHVTTCTCHVHVHVHVHVHAMCMCMYPR